MGHLKEIKQKVQQEAIEFNKKYYGKFDAKRIKIIENAIFHGVAIGLEQARKINNER